MNRHPLAERLAGSADRGATAAVGSQPEELKC